MCCAYRIVVDTGSGPALEYEMRLITREYSITLPRCPTVHPGLNYILLYTVNTMYMTLYFLWHPYQCGIKGKGIGSEISLCRSCVTDFLPLIQQISSLLCAKLLLLDTYCKH